LVFENLWQVELEQTRALAQGNSVFQAEGSHLIY